jgi:hypothetical protein
MSIDVNVLQGRRRSNFKNFSEKTESEDAENLQESHFGTKRQLLGSLID